MPKSLKDILAGVKSSKVVPGSTGDEPGVDYSPKAKDEQEFVKKHKVEKHEDRVGNGDDVYNASNIKHSQVDDKKHGYKNPEDKKVNEESACSTKKPLREIAKKTRKEQTAPRDGGIDMTGAPRNTYPSFSADVNSGRNV